LQAWIGSDKSFTYDFVYDTTARQEEIYEDTVKPLIEGCFEGNNRTKVPKVVNISEYRYILIASTLPVPVP
jgi:hypothetical protein